MRNMVLVLITQVNLLLCLVNDLLDLKMIEQGKFVNREQIFNPNETFNFILQIFQ